MGHGRRAGGATVAAALVGLCALAGCSNSRGTADAANNTTSSAAVSTTTSTALSSTTTTTPATPSAVLAGYRAAWAAFEHAAADANPDDPALAATMVDPQLTGVKANLLSDQQQGIVGRGTFTLHPKITALSVKTATVIDCAYSTAVLVYAKTGNQVPPITQPENDGVTSTLVLLSGTWKVAKQTVTDGKCAPGS
jgi:hypothetical protein